MRGSRNGVQLALSRAPETPAIRTSSVLASPGRRARAPLTPAAQSPNSSKVSPDRDADSRRSRRSRRSSPLLAYTAHSAKLLATLHRPATLPSEPPQGDLPRALGLSALFALTAERNATIVYSSESIVEILGYEPQEVIGKPSKLIFHPDEIPALKEVHYHALTNEKVGSTMYMRLLHQGGFYVDCAVAFSTVYNLIVGIVTRAVNGPNHHVTRMATTAREVVEVRGGVASMRSLRSPSPRNLPATPPWMEEWVRPDPTPRTFYIVDRFTDSSRIMLVSNELIVSGAATLRDQSFYSIVRPTDRPKVRQWIEAAKTWTPIVFDDERSGGYGYLSFQVLKLPSLVTPAPGESLIPKSTDEEEEAREGQEFLSVEGIFTASSDGIAIIISPLAVTP